MIPFYVLISMNKILLVSFFIIGIGFSSFSRNKNNNLDKLVVQLNSYLSHYANFTGHEYGLVKLDSKKLGFTKKEIKELQEEDIDFPKNKDSIDVHDLIFTYQDKIMSCLTRIVKHEKFDFNIAQSLSHHELDVVSSPDNKLVNFSVDEKTGGTYRSRISIMYYTETDSIYDGDFFASDGYGLIDTINTYTGIKYLMQGSVRGCSWCFTNHISLVGFKNDTPNWDFYYRFDSRDFEDTIEVDSTKRTIEAYYHLNDLQDFCSCNSEDEGSMDFDFEKDISCTCIFKFNGETFELVEKKEKVILENE